MVSTKYLVAPVLLLVFLSLIQVKVSAQNDSVMPSQKKEIAILMFDDYETLDVFGPAEIFGRLTDLYQLKFYSVDGGIVSNRHGVPILTQKLADLTYDPFILFIPGGLGTRKEVENSELIDKVKQLSHQSEYVLTVCTGSAILAKTGALDGRTATSNKRAFSWVTSQGDEVEWDEKARWCIDGKFYTSSGVSAGMDMALGFLADRHGADFARKVAKEIEYNWIENKDYDNFVAK